MDWMNASSIEELKKLGKFKDVREKIKQDIDSDKMIKISGRGWKELYQSIQSFKEIVSKLTSNQLTNYSISKNIEKIVMPAEKEIVMTNDYFVTQSCEYIFYLVELEGKLRMDKLGIVPSLFSNQKSAKKWRDKISKAIHPDHCSHEKANEAMAELNALYHQMIGGE